METVIKLKQISKNYQFVDNGKEQIFTALKSIDLEIRQGEFVAIMGSSGSGKSTLLNILGLLDTPTSGDYEIQGQQIQRLNDDELASRRLKTIGFVFQQFNLLSKLTAIENIQMPILYSPQATEEDFSYAKTLLTKVGLYEKRNSYPHQLSGGQQQRIAIARALINKPLIILADEPTGNLDSVSEQEILKIFKDLHQQGNTIVIVTHDESVAQTANRIIRMKDGLIVDDYKKEHQDQLNQVNFAKLKSEPKRRFRLFEKIQVFSSQGIRFLAKGRMRTVLSILGILIGVSSVIAMIGIGLGAKKQIESQFSSLGARMLILEPAKHQNNQQAKDALEPTNIDAEDAQELINLDIGIEQATPVISDDFLVQEKGENKKVKVFGVLPVYFQLHQLQIISGDFFNLAENEQKSRSIVINEELAKALFQNENPIGQEVKLSKNSYDVRGVFKSSGAMTAVGSKYIAYIPIQTAIDRLFSHQDVDSIEFVIQDLEQSKQIQSKVIKYLEEIHNIPLSKEGLVYQISDLEVLIKAMNQSNETMFILLTAISSISLVVGGIGIMNIMLVSITERTKEIGLRKAVGGHRNDILLQFLIEAVLITLSGGILGVGLGVVASYFYSWIAGWPVYISNESIVLAVLFSGFMGIIFGYLPARRASELQPIQALKYYN